jgi:hypothetical protein
MANALGCSVVAAGGLAGNAGHVRRERDPHDRRKVTIVMQPPALHLAMEFFVPLGRLMHDTVADIDPPHLQRAASVIRLMTAQALKDDDASFAAQISQYQSERTAPELVPR